MEDLCLTPSTYTKLKNWNDSWSYMREDHGNKKHTREKKETKLHCMVCICNHHNKSLVKFSSLLFFEVGVCKLTSQRRKPKLKIKQLMCSRLGSICAISDWPQNDSPHITCSSKEATMTILPYNKAEGKKNGHCRKEWFGNMNLTQYLLQTNSTITGYYF